MASEERIEEDQRELQYHGVCATQIYLNYREALDNSLKRLMVHLAKCYENQEKLSPNICNTLFQKYSMFWDIAEPSLGQFYKELQTALALPADISVINSSECLLPMDERARHYSEIEELIDDYKSKIYYLQELKQRLQAINIAAKQGKDIHLLNLKYNDNELEAESPLENLILDTLNNASKKDFLQLARAKDLYIDLFP